MMNWEHKNQYRHVQVHCNTLSFKNTHAKHIKKQNQKNFFKVKFLLGNPET